MYINNTGLMWNLGKEMKAELIWAEHRYEGKSVPKILDNTRNCLSFCSSKQALAVTYNQVLKNESKCKKYI